MTLLLTVESREGSLDRQLSHLTGEGNVHGKEAGKKIWKNSDALASVDVNYDTCKFS
jgi:hypothetical protein